MSSNIMPIHSKNLIYTYSFNGNPLLSLKCIVAMGNMYACIKYGIFCLTSKRFILAILLLLISKTIKDADHKLCTQVGSLTGHTVAAT